MIKEAIAQLVNSRSLTAEQSALVMEEVMSGQATPAQLGSFLTALRMKGETVEEIAGLASVMRARALPVEVEGNLVDTCGTGGDGSATFNISTTAAFVVAGAGLKVAKHGNRAMSSQCGSADVLEALGANLELDPAQVKRCIEEAGIGFMYAPLFHPAMKNAAAPRREIGIRTVFNLLGPLTNPAGVKAQVVGVPVEALGGIIAGALKLLGSRHALVVHGEDALDEITITGRTRIFELKDGSIRTYCITPQELGLVPAERESLKGGTPAENTGILRNILAGVRGPRRDVVLLNAAAALIAGDAANSFKEGIEIARDSLDSGRAWAKMELFIKATRGEGQGQ